MAADTKPSLLFLSPCTPRDGHTGLAMRAWATSQHLRRRHDVEVAAIDSFSGDFGTRLRRCARFWAPAIAACLPGAPSDWTAANAPTVAAATRRHFDRVHVFRLATAPCADAFIGTCRCDLDLDELESWTRRDIAALAYRNRHYGLAAALFNEAAFYERAEREWLPRFDRVFTASRIEAERVAAVTPGVEVRILPNVTHVTRRTPTLRQSEGFTLLFVGNLGYYPNHEAVVHLIRDILPRWNAHRHGAVRLVVAGGGASPRLQKLMARLPQVDYRGFVERLTSAYSQADVAIVPLRAGGGTRLKILEAFAYEVPVVATTKAAEGLDVVDGRECLVGDSPDAIVHACERLLENRSLGSSLAARALAYVESCHGPSALDSLD
jgi:glycosyltransferase involved in cell wall biosynthesis